MFDDQLASPPAAVPHRALYLRWRPKRFEDVVGQEHVTRTLRNAVKLDRLAHAYLFTGPRGTGKTSVARILYRAANCEHTEDGDPCNTCALCRGALDGRALDLIEIDAASNRGIDDIRDLRDKVAYRPGEGRYRVYIVDEAHELTAPAWDAFLKTLEEPPPHAIFVLATTEAHKVPPTIVSRCQRFDFGRIPFALTRQQLTRIAESEGMQVDADVLERIALVARGGLRDAESLLDQLTAFASGPIDMTLARAALSLPSIEAVRGVLDAIGRRDPGGVMSLVADVSEGGADLRLFVDELVIHLRALLLVRTGADARLTDELPAAEVEWLRERAPSWTVGTLIQLVQTLSEALARTRDAQQFQVQTEVALLTACDVASMVALAPVPAAVSAPTPKPVAQEPVTTPKPLAQETVPKPDVSAPAMEQSQESAPAPEQEQVSAPAPEQEQVSASATEQEQVSASATEQGNVSVVVDANVLVAKWPDVVDHVKARNGILGSLLTSARPKQLENGDALVVEFVTDFNRKRAESSSNRKLIEDALEHALGHRYRLRGTVGSAAKSGQSLLDDPVINYAARTFGGQPRRVASDEASEQ
jgi:DNA polymerase-3 subunit gamma/tau